MKIGPRKTRSIRKEDTRNEWLHIDADGLVLGRLASRVALILQGKHKPAYTPHVDNGDYVVITNADKVKLTGRKMERKVYRHHNGRIGGLVERPAARLMQDHPEELLQLAIRRMLPKTKLGRRMLKKLKVYRGAAHPHQAHNVLRTQIPG